MVSEWRILRDGAGHASEQMALDIRLAGEAQLTVRLFTWDPPAMSWGLKQALPDWLAGRALAGFERVERPTGGGIAFHGSDVSVSVVAPRARARALPLRALMEAACASASALCALYGIEAGWDVDRGGTSRLTYCLTQPAPYAVRIGARKLAGFAVRRYPESWLIQGSLLVGPLPRAIAEALPSDVRHTFAEQAVALSDELVERIDPRDAADRWAQHWATWWDVAGCEALGAAHAL